ncbi:MAG TPA: carbohydrate kinase family protein [Verrucomicrobiae bacterium]|jgi:sugar/nucleoside kinase (ribokinase family)|nr:carbohydrate kinase family protein [Verrucomicrobiae bacterium]
MTKRDVSVVGELNLDLILYGLPEKLQLEREILASNLSITLGSSSAIFAHNLARLGSSVGFSSSIGGDPLGEICLQRLGESGVDLSGVRRFAEKTTGLTVILPQGKERFILTYPGTMAEMSAADLDLNYVFSAKHLHLSSYFLQKAMQPGLPDLFRQAKQRGLSTSLDTNDDPENRWSSEIHSLLKYVDLLLLNEHEAQSLSGESDSARALTALADKVSIVVMKRGARGAVARRGKEEFAAAPPTVESVDSVGAGDSFDAGFIHQFIRGAGIEDCLRFGNVAGALSTTRAGGTEAFRDEAHRLKFLRENLADFSPDPA